MSNIVRIISNQLLVFALIFSSSILCAVNYNLVTNSSKDNNINNTEIFQPEVDQYSASLNWVKTNITINENGAGKVTILVNCTPEEGHFGIYIRPIEEISEMITDEIYATTGGEILEINASSANREDLSYRVYLQNSSKVIIGQSILYHLSYDADFFGADLVTHFEVDTELARILLTRPYWDDTLEYQTMRIRLPVELTSEEVTNTTLEEMKYTPTAITSDNYNLSYVGIQDSTGKYWLNIIAEKESLAERASFEVSFYLSIEYFSLPKIINWFVMTFTLLFTLLSIGLFIVVITIANKSKEIAETYKQELHEVLKQEDE